MRFLYPLRTPTGVTLYTVASTYNAANQLATAEHFTNYHRVLNRDRWSPWVVSRLLLALLIG
jgi:hypothetical protein